MYVHIKINSAKYNTLNYQKIILKNIYNFIWKFYFLKNENVIIIIKKF